MLVIGAGGQLDALAPVAAVNRHQADAIPARLRGNGGRQLWVGQIGVEGVVVQLEAAFGEDLLHPREDRQRHLPQVGQVPVSPLHQDIQQIIEALWLDRKLASLGNVAGEGDERLPVDQRQQLQHMHGGIHHQQADPFQVVLLDAVEHLGKGLLQLVAFPGRGAQEVSLGMLRRLHLLHELLDERGIVYRQQAVRCRHVPMRGDPGAVTQEFLGGMVDHLDQHAVHHALEIGILARGQLGDEKLQLQVRVGPVFAAGIRGAGPDAEQLFAELLLPERDQLLDDGRAFGMGVRLQTS